MAGHPAEAVAPLQKAVTLNPSLAPASLFLGASLLDLGRAKEAVPAAAKGRGGHARQRRRARDARPRAVDAVPVHERSGQLSDTRQLAASEPEGVVRHRQELRGIERGAAGRTATRGAGLTPSRAACRRRRGFAGEISRGTRHLSAGTGQAAGRWTARSRRRSVRPGRQSRLGGNRAAESRGAVTGPVHRTTW
jgi:hypothetical protein